MDRYDSYESNIYLSITVWNVSLKDVTRDVKFDIQTGSDWPQKHQIIHQCNLNKSNQIDVKVSGTIKTYFLLTLSQAKIAFESFSVFIINVEASGFFCAHSLAASWYFALRPSQNTHESSTRSKSGGQDPTETNIFTLNIHILPNFHKHYSQMNILKATFLWWLTIKKKIIPKCDYRTWNVSWC